MIEALKSPKQQVSGMADAPDAEAWRDADTLRQMYHGDLMTASEIADGLGCSQATISNWLDRHDIERRTPDETRRLRGTNYRPVKEGPHHDPEWLREKYHEEGLTLQEMAEEAGLDSEVTILHRMEEHDIDRRGRADHLRKENAHRERKSYPRISVGPRDDRHDIAIHRIVAIGEFGLATVAGSVVHHKNGVIWDNRPGNLEVLDSQSEHARLHDPGRERDKHGRFL